MTTYVHNCVLQKFKLQKQKLCRTIIQRLEHLVTPTTSKLVAKLAAKLISYQINFSFPYILEVCAVKKLEKPVKSENVTLCAWSQYIDPGIQQPVQVQPNGVENSASQSASQSAAQSASNAAGQSAAANAAEASQSASAAASSAAATKAALVAGGTVDQLNLQLCNDKLSS